MADCETGERPTPLYGGIYGGEFEPGDDATDPSACPEGGGSWVTGDRSIDIDLEGQAEE